MTQSNYHKNNENDSYRKINNQNLLSKNKTGLEKSAEALGTKGIFMTKNITENCDKKTGEIFKSEQVKKNMIYAREDLLSVNDCERISVKSTNR